VMDILFGLMVLITMEKCLITKRMISKVFMYLQLLNIKVASKITIFKDMELKNRMDLCLKDNLYKENQKKVN
jgi:hypothetical protein